MDALGSNPFAVLTFIAAPAILTNAASVIALGTSNRFARAVDRVRHLAAQVEGKANEADLETRRRVRQLGYSERRALLLVRALTAFYLSIGSFAAASLASLLGALFAAVRMAILSDLSLWLALPAGITGIGGLVWGTAILVWESRLTLAILSEETAQLRENLHNRSAGTEPATPSEQ